MVTRRKFVSAASALMVPALAPGLFESAANAKTPEMTTVKIGTILVGTCIAGNLVQTYLKQQGVDVEILPFSNIVQRMQAVASGDVQIGYGGINAAVQLASHGFPLAVLANGCDGGFDVIGRAPLKRFEDLKGKKIAVQFGSLGYATLQWKLQHLNMTDQVVQLNMDNQDMPVALQRGDVDAFYATEPFPTIARINGWGQSIWLPIDTPLGKTNVGLVASQDFITKNPILTRMIVDAHVRATQALAKDNTLAVDAIVKALNVSRQAALESMQTTWFSADSGPGFQKNVMAMGDMMLQSKLIQKLPNWKEFIQTGMVA